ncbi:MAG: thiol:disulfide oxidoreductase [Sphingomonadales bacterium]|nr:thiol:disulfide oxidoreductase [Sphingomonadales bacterium]
MIDLHSNRTPNSYKPAIMLEEVGLPYRVVHYDIMKGEHFTPAYRAINPNNKLPAITDHEPDEGAGPFSVFETGAILFYLAEKSGQLLSTSFRRRSETLQWLVWQVAGLGPMHGQAHHFQRYAPEGEAYGIQRYTNEARRLLSVMEYRLRQVEFLATDYSIADIACWPFVNMADKIDISLSEFPQIERWHSAIKVRPAVVRTVTNPETAMPGIYLQKRMELTAEQWSNAFGERMLAASAVDAV